MPLIETLVPNGQGFYNNHTGPFGGAASKAGALADNSDATFNTQDLAGNPDTYLMTDPTAAAGAVVASVIVWLRLRLQANSFNTAFLRIRSGGVDVQHPGTNQDNNPGAATIRETSFDVTGLRPGGGAWTVPEIAALEAGHKCATGAPGTLPDFMRLWIVLVTEPVPAKLPQVRKILSSRVLRHRATRNRIVVPVAPELLGVDLVTDMNFADRRGPTPAGTGWGRTPIQRRLARVVAYEEDLSPSADTFLTIEAEDLRHQLVHMADGGVSSENPSALVDGVLMLDAGTAITRTFARSSLCLVPSPVDRRITAVPVDVEAIGIRGRAAEGAVQQKVLDSVFRNGFGAWTPTAGATIDTSETIFSPEVTTKHVRLLGFNERIEQASVPATATWQWLSIDHREVNLGDITQVRIRRASDAMFWDPALGWVAGATLINLPQSQTWIRSNIGPIDQTAGATTYVIRIQTAGNDDCRVFCVQLEPAIAGKGWASSRIATEGAPVTRSASLLLQSADVWPNVKGTYLVRATPNWNSADVVGATRFVLVHVSYDANNGYQLHYDASASPGKFVFVRRAAGVNYTVELVRALSAGADVSVGVTWQGTDGDNGDADWTIKLVVDGVEAKAVSQQPGRVGGTNLARGSLISSAEHWNGFLARERTTSFVYTREEIVRLLS
jgi:hypothetical protein